MDKIVAIDGHVGSGKSTISKFLAQKLKVKYINTGLMYRALSLFLKESSIKFSQITDIKNVLEKISFKYKEDTIIIDDQVFSGDKLQKNDVSMIVSTYSKQAIIRDFLVNYQRELGKREFCVMEGRDITSVVFPNAFCKFFITAPIAERAKRRKMQLKDLKEDVQAIEDQIIRRDSLDQNREHSPLVQTQDSIVFENCNKSIEEAVDEIFQKVLQVAKQKGIKL